MRRLAFLIAAAAAALLVAPPALAPEPAAAAVTRPAALSRPAVRPAVAQQEEVQVPEQWEEWDANGDDQVTFDEFQALDDDSRAELDDWVHDVLLEDYPDDQGREWGHAHFDAVTYLMLDFPPPGIGQQIQDAPGEIVEAGQEVVEEVGETAAESALGAIAEAMGGAASDLAGFLGGELAQTGRPQLTAEWYQSQYQRMLGWAALLMLPLAFGAIGSAVARGDTSQVGQTVLQVPIAYLMGLLGVSLVHAAAGLSVAMARSLVPGIEESSGVIGERIGAVLTVRPQMSQGVILLLGLAIALAALATLMWLLFTEAAVYAAVLFFPLAFAGRVWPATANWGRRLLTIALALIGARVVIFALWGMAMSGLEEFTGGDVPLRSALALMALLVMTAVAPTAALRLVPLVEGAEVAPTPGAAAQRVLGVGYQAMSLARTGGMVGRGGRGGGGRLPVTSNIAGAAPQVPAGAASRPSGSGPNGTTARAASSSQLPGSGTAGGDGGGSSSSPGRGGPSAGRSPSGGGPRPSGPGGGDGRGGGPAGSTGGEAAPERGRAGDRGGSGSPGPRAPRAPRPTPRPSTPPPSPGRRPRPGRPEGSE